MLVEAADWATDQYQKLQAWANDRFDDDPQRNEIALNVIRVACLIAVIATVFVTAWVVVTVLGALTEGLAQGAVSGLGWALGHMADWHLTEVVTKPVHDYITAHAPGLPAAADGIWAAWATAGPVLLLLCWLARSWGARLAWVLYGAATTAMVHTASPASGQLLATGITVLYWAALSVLAFRGVGRRPAVHVHQTSTPAATMAPVTEQLKQMTERLGLMHERLDRMTTPDPVSHDPF